jgi:hypothetical protein
MKKVTGTDRVGRSMFHSKNSTATMMGTAVIGVIKMKISPRSAIIVERCSSRCITNGLPLGLY